MRILKKIVNKSLAYFGYEIKRIKKNNPQPAIEPRPHKSERDANGYNIVWNSKDFIDQYTFNHLSLYNDIIEFLKDYKILDKSESIADIGCGPGNLIGLISQKYPGKLYYGFDFSKSAIKAAKLKYNKIQFQIHDIYEPLDKSFDTVICSETLEHLLNPSKH